MGKLITQVVLHANGAFGAGGGERPTGDDWDDHVVSVLNTCDGILLGRKSYELLGGYWPNDGLSGARRLAKPLFVNMLCRAHSPHCPGNLRP